MWKTVFAFLRLRFIYKIGWLDSRLQTLYIRIFRNISGINECIWNPEVSTFTSVFWISCQQHISNWDRLVTGESLMNRYERILRRLSCSQQGSPLCKTHDCVKDFSTCAQEHCIKLSLVNSARLQMTVSVFIYFSHSISRGIIKISSCGWIWINQHRSVQGRNNDFPLIKQQLCSDGRSHIHGTL